ncbi:MAG: hypothetical protein KAQ76_00510 [Elusimicrobiales bacterium]|nr:hypothetical protein [Elusimicrobiales bacterium]
MDTEKEPTNLLQSIAQISACAYAPLTSKYPFFYEYLKKYENPRKKLIFLMTAAGVGYALATKEGYRGEHDELSESILGIEGLSKFAENFAAIMSKIKDDEHKRASALPVWVISHLKGEKPTMEDVNGPGIDIAKLLDLCIRDYEAKRNKEDELVSEE